MTPVPNLTCSQSRPSPRRRSRRLAVAAPTRGAPNARTYAMSEVPGLDERGRHRRKRGFGVDGRFVPSRRAPGVALVGAQGPQEGPRSDLDLALRALRLSRKLRTVRVNRR